MTKNAKVKAKVEVVSVATLLHLLRAYDELHGAYPEHQYEGRSIGFHVLHALGYPDPEIRERLKIPEDDWRNRYRFD